MHMHPNTFVVHFFWMGGLNLSCCELVSYKGTMCDDCCVVVCCGICSWCQIARELKHRRQPQVFVNPPVNVTYQAPATTSYQQPPINPAYQPLQPNNPPEYAQPSKSSAPPGAGLYPAV